MPDGYGRPWDARVVLSVRDRRLVLPSGQLCVPADPACTQALEGLQGERLALEVDASASMADLSASLGALATALGNGGTACLAAADSRGRRCIPFRPFSGDDFGTWLDAERPLAKLRIVMRADGMEVVTDRGKVPGPDRYGPSLPSIGGRPDFDGLDSAAAKLHARFPEETIAGLAPSPSITVKQAARVLALLNGPQGERFERTFLVYP